MPYRFPDIADLAALAPRLAPHIARRLARHVRRMGGFFLLEMLAVLAVIAALVGLAVPEVRQSLRNRRVDTVAQDMVADLAWARAEAVQRGIPVALHFLSFDDCGGRLCGWEVYADANGDGKAQAGEILQVHVGRPQITLTPDPNDTVYFDKAGNNTQARSAGSLGGRYTISAADAPAGDASTRAVCINAGNRVRINLGDTCK